MDLSIHHDLLRRSALLALAALLACAPKRLEQQPVPAFTDPGRAALTLPPNRKLMAAGGSSTLEAHQTSQGVVVAQAWRGSPGGQAGQPDDLRWRYLFFPDTGEGAWTWESPTGEVYGDLHLGSGAAVDLLVEDRLDSGTGPARWVAIDRVQRRPIGAGALDEIRCGEVLSVGEDRFVFSSGAELMFWSPELAAPVSLRKEPGAVCLHAGRGAGDTWQLIWATGGVTPALRTATLTLGVGQTLGGIADLAWPDAQVALNPRQKLALIGEQSGGFELIYQAEGLRRAMYGSDGALIGGPAQLTDAVHCGQVHQEDRWEVQATPGGPVVVRCAPSGAPTPISPDLPLRALPAAPGWQELALHYDSDAALLCGTQGCDLWTEAAQDGRAHLVRARLGVIDSVNPARDASSRDAVARAVYALLHSDNEAGSVMDLAARVCVPVEALEKRMGQGVAGAPTASGPTEIVWDQPEGVITATFSPATGCMDAVSVKRKPPVRR